MATNVNDVQEQTLGLIKESQDATISAVRAWSEAVARITPDTATQPNGQAFSSPAEAVEQSFAVAGKLLQYQRDFVLGLFQAVAPVEEAVKASAKPAASKKS